MKTRLLLLVAVTLLSRPGILEATDHVHFGRNHDRTSDEFILSRGTQKTASVSDIDYDSINLLVTRAGGGDLLWFRHAGIAYVVRDPAVLEAAWKIYDPVNELGRKQAALGARQGALGTQQARIGSQQAQLGAQQASVALQQLHGSGSVSERKQERLSKQQEELSRQQEKLSERQEELSRQQELFSREQDAASQKASVAIQVLIDQALRDGVARRQ